MEISSSSDLPESVVWTFLSIISSSEMEIPSSSDVPDIISIQC